MDTSLCLLISSLLESTPETPTWDTNLNALVDRVLKWRKIIRPRPNVSLEGIYLEIYQALHQSLVLKIGDMAKANNALTRLSKDWLLNTLHLSYKDLLTDERLTQLAIQVQQSTPRSPDWQYAMTELFRAIELSQKLRSPSWRKKVDHHAYEDILNEVFKSTIEKIHTFDASRAHFMGWMNNTMLGLRGIDIREKQKDTVGRGPHQRIMRIKYALSHAVRKTNWQNIQSLLYFYWVKPLNNIYQDACLLLSLVLGLLHRQLQVASEETGELLYHMAVYAVGAPAGILQSLDKPRSESAEDSYQTLVDTLPQQTGSPPKIDFLRECLTTCHQEACQSVLDKHLRGRPEATFRHILLQRLEGKTLQEIGTCLGVGIPTVDKHFRRNLKHVSECLGNCVDDKVEQWKMLNS